MKVITANRLIDGKVVYYATDRTWSEDIANALRIEDDRLAHFEELAEEGVRSRHVVALYAFDIINSGKDGPASALSMRERIRASHEPTIQYDRGSWSGRTE